MPIERDAQVRFHELGTLMLVTRWIRTHDAGLAEWLKNARRAYQPDFTNVAENHRAAVVLLMDATRHAPARIGLLDVGGATLEDVDRWSVWDDPTASTPGSGPPAEVTQGNGGKAYMYSCFKGPCRILGVRDRRLNCKGFEGEQSSLDRGTTGFMPDNANGRNREVPSWEVELTEALKPYNLRVDELPPVVQAAIKDREAFTLVEGVDPIDTYQAVEKPLPIPSSLSYVFPRIPRGGSSHAWTP